jgi:hypothetical protein
MPIMLQGRVATEKKIDRETFEQQTIYVPPRQGRVVSFGGLAVLSWKLTRFTNRPN